MREAAAQPRHHLLVKKIALVEHLDRPDRGGTDLVQHVAHGVDLRLELGRRGIHYMQNQVGPGNLVQGGLERLHKRGWQLLDEADGIGHGNLATLRQLELARRGVQRSEQFVVAEHIGPGQSVDERRLPRIGITGQGHLEHAAAVAALSLQLSHFGKMGQFAANGGDALAHHAAVHFQLALTLAEARSHAAAHTVRGQMRPHTAQARVEVLVLGQPHLKTTFLGGGVQGEDVQYEGRPVDDLHGLVHDLLEIRLLGGGQLIVEDDQVRLAAAGQLGDLHGLARSHEGAGIGGIESLGRGGHDIGSGRIGQTLQLGQRRLQRPFEPWAIDAHDNSALATIFRLRDGALLDNRLIFGHGVLLMRSVRLKGALGAEKCPTGVWASRQSAWTTRSPPYRSLRRE